MKCKPGDMCVVLPGANGSNAGKLVTTIRLLGDHEHTCRSFGPMWLVDRDLSFTNCLDERHWYPWAPDKCLLPIKPKGDEVTERSEDLVSTE
jgi:hypothetical protein